MTEYRWPLLFCPGSSFRSRLSLGGGTGNGPMISLRPSLITEHHSVSSLNDLAREASPCSRYLRPARDEDTTYTVGGNCSRVDGDKRTERIEPRSYSPDASVDQHRSIEHAISALGRSDRRANGCSAVVTNASVPRRQPRGGAECGRVHRDHPKAEHVPVELGERGRVPLDEADLADTDHLRRSSLGHGLSRFL